MPAHTQNTLINELIASAHDAAHEKLVVSTSGNFSVRLGSDQVAISAARTRLGKLHRGEVLIVRLDGSVVGGSVVDAPVVDASVMDNSATVDGSAAPQGSLVPSRETPMHLAVYRNHPTVRCFFHFQGLAATTLGCRDAELPDLDFIPELPVYVRRIGSVPYLPPGSTELAEAVAAAYQDPDVRVVHLRNHGQVVIGDTPSQALERATFFELACRIHLLAEPVGNLKRYSHEDLALLMSY